MKRKILYIFYALINLEIGIYFLHMAENLHNKIIILGFSVLLLQVSGVIGISAGTILSYCERICSSNKKFGDKSKTVFSCIGKAISLCITIGLVSIYFWGKRIIDFWHRNKELPTEQDKRHAVGYIIGDSYILTVIYIVSKILYCDDKKITYEYCVSTYARTADVLLPCTKRCVIILLNTNLYLLGGSDVFRVGVKNSVSIYNLTLYPILLVIYLFASDTIVSACLWNYDWEKTYEKELLEKGIAPNINTIPFPK